MKRRVWKGTLSLVLLLGGLVFAYRLPAQPLPGRLFFHFINVGQADAILIMDEAKTCTILIDSGDTRYPDSAKDFKKYLSDHLPVGSDITLAIASHPHNDHIGSMQWVLTTYRVKNYIDNGRDYPSQLYKKLMEEVQRQRQQQLAYVKYASVPPSLASPCGPRGPKLQVLYPQAGLDPDVCAENANNCSVTAKLGFGSTRFLFPGDGELQEEAILLADAQVKAQLAADVLKVGHHGPDTSSGEDFLAAVKPSWMVISAGQKDVGTNNGYKHPRWSTIQDLLVLAGPKLDARMIDAYDATGKQWRQVPIWGGLYVTARDGTAVLSSDGTQIRKD